LSNISREILGIDILGSVLRRNCKLYLTEYGHLVVDEFGVSLKKKRRRVLVITRDFKEEIPIKSIKELIIAGKANLSSELIRVLVESGVDLLFTSPTGRPIARLVGTRVGGTAKNRYEQYKSLEDDRGIQIAKSVMFGKFRNQMSNMRYYSKSRRATEEISAKLFDTYFLMKKKLEEVENQNYNTLDEARARIMSLEGEIARIYWDGMRYVFDKWKFNGRNHRSNDPVNFMLNIAYNMLSGQIWKYILRFGLDPFLGYVHVERPGKLSLVFDLMEPYRPFVDRLVASFLKDKSSLDFSKENKSLTIKKFREEFYNFLTEKRIEYKGRKMRVETSMFYYVQEIVSFLRRNTSSISVPYLSW